MKHAVILMLMFIFSLSLSAQKETRIHWIDFNQLDKEWKHRPKKILIFFYENRCVYCKKMEKTTFNKTDIVDKLNKDFHAVKMNAHTTDTIVFNNRRYTNPEAEKNRAGIHQLAAVFMHREGRPYSLPVTVLLDENLNVVSRSFTYLSPKAMRAFISQ